MESETKDTLVVVDGDCCDLFVLRQEVVISLSHLTIRSHKWIVTPCSILEYHVEHTTTISLCLTIVFPSSDFIVR